MSVVNDDGVPFGWAITTVENLAANEPAAITDGPFGSNLKSDHYTEAGPRVIRLQNIGDGCFLDEEAHISESHFATLRKHEACAADIVVAMLGEELPRACLVPDSLGPAIVKADCVRLRVHPDLAIPEYVVAGLNSQKLRRQAAEVMHGVGRPRLGLQWFRGLHFPVAPLREQRRIVESIESYFTRLDDAVATLERVARNLKRYRASVLKSAVEGRLVPTEAALAKQEGRDYEPASVLLERILTERRRRWAESSKKGKYEAPPCPDTTNLPDLPEGWCWATVEQLASPDERSIQSGPFGSSLRHSEFVLQGKLVIGIDNVQDGYFSIGAEHRISDQKYKILQKFTARPGDVLVTVMATVGRTCVVPDDLETAIITKHVYRISPDQELVLPRFLHLCLWGGPVVREQMFGQVQGQTRPGLNGAIIKGLIIPLPPLDEQGRILGEAERLLSVGKATQAEMVQTERRLMRLRQSILKWAFEGKLADQDPSDEPASALLARIKAERDTTQPAKKKSRA